MLFLILVNHPKVVDLSDKSVILGDLSAAVKDFSNTPLDSPLANPLIYGIAISNIINKQFIYTASYQLTIIYLSGNYRVKNTNILSVYGNN